MLDPADVPKYFRANVGVVLVDSESRVFAFQRRDVPDAWQCIQGGLESGDTPRQAAVREIIEETGIQRASLEFIAEHPQWLPYELPEEYWSTKTGRGQVQKWFLFRFTGQPSDFRFGAGEGAELVAYRLTTLADLVDVVAAFRQPVYEQVAAYFSPRL